MHSIFDIRLYEYAPCHPIKNASGFRSINLNEPWLEKYTFKYHVVQSPLPVPVCGATQLDPKLNQTIAQSESVQR